MKIRYGCVVSCMIVSITSTAFGQTGYSITGGMSNFDCSNHCDEPCDEFEVEIEDIHPEDVVHTYHNSNYGSPTVTPSSSGGSTIVDYRNPQHLTPVGAIEHFGISLRQLGPTNTIRVRWMRNGQTATVNGQVPVAGGGTAPASQPLLPSISADMDFGSTGGDGVSCTITNNDLGQSIWVKRRGQVSQGVVTLEQLMPNDPVVTTTVAIDAAPILLGPGQSLTHVSDLIEIEDNESVVFAAEYYQDLTQNGPFFNTHAPGPVLGNVMTASLASPETGCDMLSPIIIEQPQNVTADEGHSADVRIDADGNDLPVTYQWLKEGQPLANGGMFHGVTSDELSIDELTAETEGFYSVRISNTCGTTVSDSALVFITGHNVAPSHPCDPVAPTSLAAQSMCMSGFASLVVGTTGTAPFTYQWRIETEPGVWALISDMGTALPCGGEVYASTPDANSTDIYLIPCDGVDAYRVRCQVSNACGSAPSGAATLHIFDGYPGDLNGDWEINGGDIQTFVDVMLGANTSSAALCAVDINQNQNVDSEDITLFVDYLLEL